MDMGICAFRGAICVKEDSPCVIEDALKKLWDAIERENRPAEDEIAFLLFSQTSDLQSRNPAGALRKWGHCCSVPLFCMQEPQIAGMMKRVIRVLVVMKDAGNKSYRPVYLDGAERLRPDLTSAVQDFDLSGAK